MRRRAPRAIAAALADLTADLAPATTLARVQGAWNDAVGETLAREAQPVSEREGVITVTCRSAVWAQELELLAPDLVERLNAGLDGHAVKGLRFRVGTLA